MLVYEGQEQSEKRGRFLIQEIEEDAETSLKPPLSLNKRTKHSSIIIDSKIIHTTRADSNFNSLSFSTFIWDENKKDWLDFESIWKNFSKLHTDCLEDEMEKIFHYIDNRIDDSDFFYIKDSHLHEGDYEKVRENNNLLFKNKNSLDYSQCKTFSDLDKQRNSIIKNKKIKTTMDLPLLHTPNKNKKSSETRNKSLILTNFNPSSFISPAVSPISSSKKLIDVYDNQNISNSNKIDKIILPLSIKKFTLSENPIRLKGLTELSQQKSGEEFYLCNPQEFQLVHNINFTLSPTKNLTSQNLKIVNECNILKSNQENLCIICKNKI